jgi:hypothetical protein
LILRPIVFQLSISFKDMKLMQQAMMRAWRKSWECQKTLIEIVALRKYGNLIILASGFQRI